ncbi:hypothetical protein BAMA_15675 [Bacillus manliponensis]|uniref:Uncharacterized protein n=1 Tax=Bacillus manliponensis TaxID=574376 RepID=A0A073JT06_9BACI|nr:hypothetical protein [Bacillus manliponensis]KEK17326.1 hypothetical protein BAMA_15675 [Bacillus manliponensis]
MKNEILKKYVKPEVTIILFGFFGAIKMLLDSLGYHVITEDAISAAVNFVCWSIVVGTIIYKAYVSKFTKSRQN